jgi:hypothetical protein
VAAVAESMTKIKLDDGRIVRVWRNEDPGNLQGSYAQANKSMLFAVRNWAKIHPMADLAERILAVEAVSAVEIIEEDGCGIVLYKEWP